jgi:clumping factor A
MKTRLASSLLALSATGLLTVPASADPQRRVQVNQRGDFVLLGNTIGYECNDNPDVPTPLVGTVDCQGDGETNDTAPDIFWQSADSGSAQANADITAAEARSTAMLVLPTNASVTHAYVYWAGLVAGGNAPDASITIDRPGMGGFAAVNVTTATTANQPPVIVRGDNAWYQSVADVTSLVQANGSGAYRVSGIGSLPLVSNQTNHDLVAGWVMVVLYELASEPPRNLAIFDGLDLVSNTGSGIEVDIAGFLVPSAGFDAKLGVVTYEGELTFEGDELLFNDNIISNALNPADNFFNSTRSFLGAAVSNAGDLPQLTGTANSMGGLDFDVVDIEAYLQANDEAATIGATTSGDTYLLGAFVTSISTFKPDFSSSNKSFVDLNGGILRPHDTIEYTIVAQNDGNDTSINTVMTDPLPDGVTYVPGSISITAGANSGPKTDATGDDQANYDAATRTITVRLGTGANSSSGGEMAPNESTTIKFRVKIDPDASGSILNQAIITGEGEQGAPEEDYPTDGNGAGDGVPPTEVVVEDCADDTECNSQAPFCDTVANPNACVECLTDDDCDGASAPDCLPATNTCGCAAGAGQCSTDSDGDGLSDDEEEDLGTNPNDADSDDDGASDGDEPQPGEDSDDDGLINALDPDSDNDGLFDGTELGDDCDGEDTNASAGQCTPDADDGLTTTDPLDSDTDDGGVSDGSEDNNLDGAIDDGETDPNDPSDDSGVQDTDEDGLSDDTEETIGTDPNDADSDDDGVSDGGEPNPTVDTDGDGDINALDPDSDDDDLFDGTELGLDCEGPGTAEDSDTCIADADDGDTTTNPLDPDTDDGGVEDGDEDSNHDGAIDDGETDPNDPSDDEDAVVDSDDDGLSDDEEEDLGTDPSDADSDDDGAIDGDEVQPGDDTDNDGLINGLDPDSDDDGLFDGTELGQDCDSPGTDPGAGNCTADGDSGDTTTDPLDADTDDGGVNDGSEDTNLDGVIDDGETDPNDPSDDTDVVDSDDDGLSDDTEDTLGTDPNDADSDDDGVLDGDESNPGDDTDGDGSINALDPDSDNDGLFDGTEIGNGCDAPGTDAASQTCIPDGDGGATTTSPLDPDTDDGGVSDGDEDVDHDGVIDDGETDPNDGSDDSAGTGGTNGSGGSTGTGSGGTPIVLNDGSIEGGGCSCRSAGGGSYGSLGGWLAALAAAGIWRRRSKRLSSRG